MHAVYNDLKDMRLPAVAKKTNKLNIDCFLGERVKLGSVAGREHFAKMLGHGDCYLTSSNVPDVIERF